MSWEYVVVAPDIKTFPAILAAYDVSATATITAFDGTNGTDYAVLSGYFQNNLASSGTVTFSFIFGDATVGAFDVPPGQYRSFFGVANMVTINAATAATGSTNIALNANSR